MYCEPVCYFREKYAPLVSWVFIDILFLVDEKLKLSNFLQKKRKIILEIAKEHGALSICIFGSYARGEEQPQSDIDLIVEMDSGRSLLDVIAIKQEIEDAVHKKVDIVTRAALSPYLREEVLREAVA